MLVLAGLAALSCASGQRPAAQAPESRDRRAEEILALDTQIREWRVQGGLSAFPDRKFYNQPEMPQPQTPYADECRDICSLADAICSNKDRICDIAGEMPEDTWAKGKCDSAKASCNEARDRCTNCGK